MLSLAASSVSMAAAVIELAKEHEVPVSFVEPQKTKIIVLPHSCNAIDLYQVVSTGTWKNGYGHKGVTADLRNGTKFNANKLDSDWKIAEELDYLNAALVNLQ